MAAASKYGATEEIAETIGRVLTERGLLTDVRSIDDVLDVSEYDAFVVGSAVYAGHWLEPARLFVDQRSGELADRPTWLFSSGPIGDPPRPSEGEAEGDFRDWDSIAAWAGDIADALEAQPSRSPSEMA